MPTRDFSRGDDIQHQLDLLIRRVREDVARVPDPGFRALLETTAEVLLGLKSAYRHHEGRQGYSHQSLDEMEADRAEFYRSHLSPH